MNNLTALVKVYHRLMELMETGYNVSKEENLHKNYIAYTIGKRDGNAKFSDCVIVYNGDEEASENKCTC